MCVAHCPWTSSNVDDTYLNNMEPLPRPNTSGFYKWYGKEHEKSHDNLATNLRKGEDMIVVFQNAELLRPDGKASIPIPDPYGLIAMVSV